MKRINVRTLLCVLSLAVLPAGVSLASSPAWVEDTTINLIHVQPNGRIYVKVNSGVPDLGCTSSLYGMLELDTTAQFFKEHYAAVVAAHMAGRTVRIYVSGCGHYPYAQNLEVKQ